MTERAQRIVFIVALLPGIVFPFLSFTWHVSQFQALDPRAIGTSMAMAIAMTFAPAVVITLETWRLVGALGALTWLAWIIALVQVSLTDRSEDRKFNGTLRRSWSVLPSRVGHLCWVDCGREQTSRADCSRG